MWRIVNVANRYITKRIITCGEEIRLGNMAAWDEVSVAKNENRHELVLRGSQISKRIDKNGIDPNIFKLTSLNYLEISGTSLSSLDSGIGELVNLGSLLLCNNKLTVIPPDIGRLNKLKILNLSNNLLEAVPSEISLLIDLDTLNLSMNRLKELPSVTKMKCLHVVNVSNNKLCNLPDGIFELVHLSQILASDNEIAELAPEVSDLPHLNILDLSNNKLTEVTGALNTCPKLKELHLKGNKFKDKKLGKLVEQNQMESCLKALQNFWKKENQKAGKGTKDKESKKKKKGKKSEEPDEEIQKDTVLVKAFPKDVTGVEIKVLPAVLSVRQYIVCCVIRDLDLTSKFKEFITLQTKLHDTVCQKRQVATIATHNLKSVKLPLTYDAMFPQLLKVIPLFKHKEVTGEKLVEDLRHEAEEQRKEKKRNTVSGIHKYLDLLTGKTQYPCLVDRDGTVISFPPITNSDITKISKDTTDILVEVTCSTNLDTCKKVMDEVIYQMLATGIVSKTVPKAAGATAKGNDSDSEDSDEGVVFKNPSSTKTLVVEQVKVVNADGGLKVLYPSRTDLQSEAVRVIRD